MPRTLLARCRVDCVAEFRRAAWQRFEDGLALAPRGRRTAAIYLWGYAAEMTLKAAYFQLIGFSPSQTITLADLKGAVATAPKFGVVWTGNYHNLEGWAQLLVSTRAGTPGSAYASPLFGNDVAAKGRQLRRLWNEILRYHKNVAYRYEVEQVRRAAEWLLMNSSQL